LAVVDKDNNGAARSKRTKYEDIWDVMVYFNYLCSNSVELKNLEEKELRARLIMLLQLARMGRSSNVARITYNSIQTTKEKS